MNRNLYPPRNRNSFRPAMNLIRTLLGVLALTLTTIGRAALPEPDTVIYGNITLDNVLVTAARNDVVVEARRTTNGPAIASYRMGRDAALGNFYALPVTMESVAPLSDPNAAQVGEQVFVSVLDQTGLRLQAALVIAERGDVQRIDFGVAVPDGDADGLPDAWELQWFGSLNRHPASPTANGFTALDHFIAGTDPNGAGFRLHLTQTNQQKRVSFLARRAEGPGYTGMTRLYTLETRATLAAGSWSGVLNYVDIAGADQTVEYVTTDMSGSAFFRGKIVLQGFNIPGTDTDTDGLPDVWETTYFGNLTQTATSLSSNGQPASVNYIAGNNPNNVTNVFRLEVARVGGQTLVSFLARRAQGVGYDGLTRHYALESSGNLNTWSGVANYTNVIGDEQNVAVTVPGAGAGLFYRCRVWLEP